MKEEKTIRQGTINELNAVFNRVKEQEPENHLMIFYGDSDAEFCVIQGSREDLIAALITMADESKSVEEIIFHATGSIEELTKHPELYTNTKDNEND